MRVDDGIYRRLVREGFALAAVEGQPDAAQSWLRRVGVAAAVMGEKPFRELIETEAAGYRKDRRRCPYCGGHPDTHAALESEEPRG